VSSKSFPFSPLEKSLTVCNRFFCSRETIFHVIKLAYLSLCQENLPIFGITKNRALADFATTEKDVARGISRMPLVLARIYEEDIQFDATAQSRPKFTVSPSAAQRE